MLATRFMTMVKSLSRCVCNALR